MAYHTVEDGPWPKGTTVSVWPSSAVSGGVPTGAPLDVVVADPSGTATFGGLTEGVSYTAFGHGGSQVFTAANEEANTGAIAVIRQAPLNVRDPAYGALGDDAANDKAAIQAARAAMPARGGEMYFPPGIYRTDGELTFDAGVSAAQKVKLIGDRAQIKATAAMSRVVLLKKITDAQGLGVHGIEIDMAGLATTGLELQDCWDTENWVRVINVAGNTGVKIISADTSFGAHRNRVDGQARGNDTAASVGVLIQGVSGGAANGNVIAMHATDCATGIKQGSFCDVNFVHNSDCTSCAIALDVTSGIILLSGFWEEQSTSKGIIVRTGARVRGQGQYVEQRDVEGTAILKDGERRHATTTGAVEDEVVWTVNGLGVWRHQFDPAAGRWSWKEDGQTESLGVDNSGIRVLRGSIRHPTYTVATRPAAASHTGGIIFVSDGAAGAKFQGSDGSSWVNLG